MPPSSVARAVRVAAAALICTTATACAGGSGGGGESGGRVGQLAVNAARPFDIYLGEQVGLIQYAELKVRNQCLADAGYPQNLQLMLDAPALMNVLVITPSRYLGHPSEGQAREHGFGFDSPSQPGRVVSFDSNYDTNLERCEKEAWARLGADAKSTHDQYIELANTLSSELAVVMRSEVPKGLPALVACLSEAGYTFQGDLTSTVLYDVPKKFGISLGRLEGGPDTWEPKRIKGTVEVGPPTPYKRYVPTPEESELAVAWYRCDRRTGRVDHLMKVAVETQQAAVARHESEIAELNSRIDAMARRAAELAGRAQ